MNARPGRDEAAPYYFRYIDQIAGDDCLAAMAAQLDEAAALFAGISDEHSTHRYAADKWSLRQVLGHINDTERIFAGRALWFARGLPSPLPSFEQEDAVCAAQSDRLPWAAHIEEFRSVRRASLDLFRHLPAEAWNRRGTASGNEITVRAIGFILPGHVAHHLRILHERYL